MDILKVKEKDNSITQREYDEEQLKHYMNSFAEQEKNIINYAYNDKRIFLASNMVGEYAELIACQKLGLTKMGASEPYFDAVKDNKRYQIKSRWYNSFGSKNGKGEFGSINEEVIKTVDYLVLVIFKGDDFNSVKLYTLDLKSLPQIREACENKKISQFIVSKKQKDGKYKVYFKEDAFEEACKIGLMSSL